jgi:hypothetical protein
VLEVSGKFEDTSPSYWGHDDCQRSTRTPRSIVPTNALFSMVQGLGSVWNRKIWTRVHTVRKVCTLFDTIDCFVRTQRQGFHTQILPYESLCATDMSHPLAHERAGGLAKFDTVRMIFFLFGEQEKNFLLVLTGHRDSDWVSLIQVFPFSIRVGVRFRQSLHTFHSIPFTS